MDYTQEILMESFPEQGVCFAALGGIGEIGMNLYAYSYNGNIMLVDMGMGFADDDTPSIDVFLPDVDFLEKNKDKVKGLVLTHAHEDHVGAVCYGMQQIGLDIPIYATPFVAEIMETKFDEKGLLGRTNLQTVPCGGDIFVAGFEVSFVPLPHSIPEAQGLFIKAGDKKIFHTGDWKFDRDPVIGSPADYAELGRIGDLGIDYMMCDSTNVPLKSPSRSESEVRDSLIEIIPKISGKIIVTCFASNVARLSSIAKAADAAQRSVCLVGRSLKRMEGAARAVGYLEDIPPFVSESDALTIPDDNILYICTGSQGEGRSALDRISRGEFKSVFLQENDTVIFSSKTIPGNDKSVLRLQNRLSQLRVKIITDKDAFVHVSGHPGKPELKEMYRLIRPKCIVPVHGELKHLKEQADFAKKNGIDAIEIINGDVLELADEPKIIGSIKTGLFAYDGDRIVSMDEKFIRARKKISYNGSAVITVVVDKKGGFVAEPKLSAPDLFDDDAPELGLVIKNIKEEMKLLSKEDKKDDDVVKELLRVTVRRGIYNIINKKPITTVHLVRI
jgi:ribonuclease J